MALDAYLTLGRSGLRVSPLCLGAMTFGTGQGWTCDEASSTSILRTYLDAGGNFIDTADIYTVGESERIVGRSIIGSSARDRVVLATKYTFGGVAGAINSYGNGRKNAYRALDASLDRLGTDYLDLYWVHAWDTVTPAEELVQTFDALIRQGKIRYYGLSDVPAWFASQVFSFAQTHGLATPVALQLEYSLIQRVIEREHLPFAAYAGLGLCPWSPLAGGILSGKYNRNKTSDDGRMSDPAQRRRLNRVETWTILDTMQEIASESGYSLAEIAIRWITDRYRSTSVILGATSADQLRTNVAALECVLTADQLERLDRVSRLEALAPYNFFLPHRLEKTMGGPFKGFDRPAFA